MEAFTVLSSLLLLLLLLLLRHGKCRYFSGIHTHNGCSCVSHRCVAGVLRCRIRFIFTKLRVGVGCMSSTHTHTHSITITIINSHSYMHFEYETVGGNVMINMINFFSLALSIRLCVDFLLSKWIKWMWCGDWKHRHTRTHAQLTLFNSNRIR